VLIEGNLGFGGITYIPWVLPKAIYIKPLQGFPFLHLSLLSEASA
jgi:hypothetical protein